MAGMMDRIMGMPQEAPAQYAFAAPPGFSVPDEVQEGQPFEVVAKIRLADGQLVFDEINGLKLDAPAPEEEVESDDGFEDEDGGDTGDMTDDSEAAELGGSF